MGKGAGAVGTPEKERGDSYGWLDSGWASVEGEAREGVTGWCWAGWGLVFLMGPSSSDPLRPG